MKQIQNIPGNETVTQIFYLLFAGPSGAHIKALMEQFFNFISNGPMSGNIALMSMVMHLS